MKVACIQMDNLSLDPDQNYRTVSERIEEVAASLRPDVITLPETWNTGYIPREGLDQASDTNGERTKRLLGALSRKHAVNIVGGSVSDRRDGGIYNTTYVFDRQGECVFRYDKIHLLSRFGENVAYRAGNTFGSFLLDGVPCTAIICYDIRFPEICRAVAEPPVKMMFVSAQWPKSRSEQLTAFLKTRAMENEIFLVANSSTPPNRQGQNRGGSAIVAPRGNVLVSADSGQDVIFADLDLAEVDEEQMRRPVWADRRPELFR
ncbi:MAG: carbon-nitrogen family hydrolase [Clostridia bacterium]|nr:carbon-nitrogen family hydrolase [Clostridia bacterium]